MIIYTQLATCFYCPVYTSPDTFLHGRILFLDGLFTWIRAGSVQILLQWIRAKFRPVAAFQAITALSEQKVARFGCLHESVQIWNRAGQKVDLLFFRSQTCTLSRSKFRPVPPVPCKRKVELCKFLSVQRFVRTRVNGA